MLRESKVFTLHIKLCLITGRLRAVCTHQQRGSFAASTGRHQIAKGSIAERGTGVWQLFKEAGDSQDL